MIKKWVVNGFVWTNIVTSNYLVIFNLKTPINIQEEWTIPITLQGGFDYNVSTDWWYKKTSFSFYTVNIVTNIPLNIKVYFQGQEKYISNIKKIYFPTSQESKTSWGSSAYYDKTANDVAQTINWSKYFLNDVTKYDIINNDDSFELKKDKANKIASLALMDLKEKFMSAVIISKQWFGIAVKSFAIETPPGNYIRFQNIIQIITTYYTKTWGSLSRGTNWINFGKTMVVNFKGYKLAIAQ